MQKMLQKFSIAVSACAILSCGSVMAQTTVSQETLQAIEECDALVALWDFKEAEGTPRKAVGQGEFPLSEQNGTVARADEGPLSGYSGVFGGGSYLSLPNDETGELNIVSPGVTVIAWVKRQNREIGFVAGMWNEYEDGGKRQYGLFVSLPTYNGADQVCGHISRTGGPTPPFPYSIDYSASAQKVETGQWYCVGFTYDGTYIKSYLDGEFVEREEELINNTTGYEGYPNGLRQSKNPYYYPDGMGDNGSDFTVGAVKLPSGMGNLFNGRIGGVAVFNRALTSEEMAQFSQMEYNDPIDDFEIKDGAIQINTQEDFDKWVQAVNAAPSMQEVDVDLNTDIAVVSDNCIIEKYTGVFNGNYHTIDLQLYREAADVGLNFIRNLYGTVQNVFFSGTIEGNGKNFASVAYETFEGAVVQNVSSSVNIISHFVDNAVHAGIVSRCQGATTLKNIIYSGKISNPDGVSNNCGGIVGWLFVSTTIENCLMLGEISSDIGGSSNIIARHDVNLVGKNIFALATNHGVPASCTIVTPEELESGAVCYALNGETFVNPSFFQNIGSDAHPSLDNSHGVVYPTADGYASVDSSTPESFSVFKKGIVGVMTTYLESEDVLKYGGAAPVAEYAELVAACTDAADMESLAAAYTAGLDKKNEVAASVTAYMNYEALIEELVAELESRDDFSGPDRDFLESEYIDGGLAPGDDDRAPNGSSDYILENRLLTVSELEKECEHARELLRIAIANGNEVGADITDMLLNANFADGFNGWQGTVFTGYGADTREGSTMHAAEIWSADAHDMYQEIVVTKSGVYELQVRGAYRPFDEQNSIQYYPYVYLNGNVNYLQTVIEDYVSVEDAVDGENCYITPGMSTLDRPITNEEGDTIGWALHGVQSCNVAFTAGRYDNRILIYANEGETLRIGINHPSSEYGGNEWVGIGDIHLTYHGELEEANEALDRVLESMLFRANTLLAIESKSDETYTKYPNYSQALKDRVVGSIEKAAAAADAATKYAVIEELSAAFVEIIDCKKAYRSFFTQLETAYARVFDVVGSEPAYEELRAEIQAIMDEGMAAYESGSMTAEEANECAIAKDIEFPVVQINSQADFDKWVEEVNASTSLQGMDVFLNTDIAVASDNCIIENYRGVFNGNNHTIDLQLYREAADVGLNFIRNLYGTVQNVHFTGTIEGNGKNFATVAYETFEGAVVQNVSSSVHIISHFVDNAVHAGIVSRCQGATTLKNIIYSGKISNPDGVSNNCGGIVGWLFVKCVFENCLMIGDMSELGSGCNIITRNQGNLVGKNLYAYSTKHEIPSSCTIVTPEELASGAVCYALNGDQSEISWWQTIGTDAIPTFNNTDNSHKQVYKAEDGTYYNDKEDGIHSVTIDTKGRIYTINGVRVEKTTKGLYIINGKKVMIK